MSGRLVRDHQRDRDDGVGTVQRTRLDVIQEMLAEAEAGGTQPEAVAWLRQALADEMEG